MGCVCCSLSSFISILLDALERISLCTVCALLTCCLLFTIIAVMVMGIGIGFHYCFVQNSVDSMAKAAKAAGATRSGPESGRRGLGGPMGQNIMRSMGRAANKGFAYRSRKRRELQGLNFTDINGTFTNGTYNITYDEFDNITYDDNDTNYYNDSFDDDNTTLNEDERKSNATNFIAHVYHIIKNITRF